MGQTSGPDRSRRPAGPRVPGAGTQRLDFELLRTLLAIGDSRTFAEAAARRGVTPPAISQQMKTLEAQLGVRLFQRVGRRAVLTPKGVTLVQVLRASFSRIDDAIEQVVDDAVTVTGVVRLGGPAPFSAMWLRPRLASLMRAHPALQLEVEYAVPSVLVQRLARGELDLALVVRAVVEPGLESRVVHVETFTAVAAPRLLRRGPHPVTADDFRAQSFLVFDRDLAMLAPWWHSRFGRKEPLPARVACAVTSLDDLRALAIEGLGITVLPTYFVQSDLAAGRLVSLDAEPSAATARSARNPISLCWRTAAIETARFRAVRGALLAR